MDSFSIRDLSKIIERDYKDATYKFALLRGTIEIIQDGGIKKFKLVVAF